MKTVIVQHEVKNFIEWKKIFDADQSNLQKEGVQLKDLYNSATNANDVTMIFEIPDEPGLFDKVMSDPQRQAAMKIGGVVSKPTISILNKV
ncbi:hypothetical protein [Aequorivita sp. KMM 9714]|uniref:hypothetical protein n=1 Tax=Aequorivita sp. KMM 9714 TaxID=2707173 RepID=UPI0013ECF64A|nr:hypothetical protein [Aequorivita sp. KMM 9714]NGX83562.1 hypothetical protein [Aequorivita sp. KMM 9714]